MPAKKQRGLLLVAGVLVVALVAGYLVRRQTAGRLPSANSPVYEEMVRTFYRALAQLEVGLLDDAKRGFTRATQVVPEEPAAWANLSLTEIRLGEYDLAVPPIERAAALAPASSDIQYMFGELETSRGRLDEGLQHLQRAVELDPAGLRPRAALAQEIERAGGQNADVTAQALYEDILKLRAGNLAALIERTRLAAKRGDLVSLQDSVRRLGRDQRAWPGLAVEQYRALENAVQSASFTDASRAVAFLRNVLVRAPAFRESLAEIRAPSELIAEPLARFVKLPVPDARPFPPDLDLTFSRELMAADWPSPLTAISAFSLNGIDPPVIYGTDGRELRRVDGPGPTHAISSSSPSSAPGLLALDWSRHFKTDLAVAGSGGLRFFVQNEAGSLADATREVAARADSRVADLFTGTRPLTGLWTADLDMDGDLDLIVSVKNGPPVVLRNNGDGSWSVTQPFPASGELRDFAWGDLDGDGVPDAVLLDAAGTVHVFINRQAGQFRAVDAPTGARDVTALALGDINGDGRLDLVTFDGGGSIKRASMRGGAWDQQSLAAWTDPLARGSAARVLLADLDNNGALDLVVSIAGHSRVWLAGDRGAFLPLPGLPDADVFGVVDLNGDGQLDLVGLQEGRPVRLLGHGTKGYHWQVFRPRAQQTAGDQRINSFGVGGDIEIRAGLLSQKQTLTGAPVHFGLGTRTGIDVARIVWPNGVMQAEFDRRADETIVAEQRLKGSCPWVFADDGTGIRFVTDFLWRSPLGLRINAQDTAGVSQTEDWVKIRGDQLVPRNNRYDIRITAELWESHFIDQVSLLVVDHPADAEVFVDERFSKQAPALTPHAVKPPQPVAGAWDDTGRDVTERVRRRDGRYLATFERGLYQGIAHEHYVEVELGRTIRPGQPLWLVANGWVYPTDSSINVAVGQGHAVRPHGLSLEAQGADGRWVIVDPDLGFPAGKNKTILVDLRHVPAAGVRGAHRLRLRTNLEVYWDSLAVADSAEDAPLEMHRVQPERAWLRYRGFSQTTLTRDRRSESNAGQPAESDPEVPNRLGPETPLYDTLSNVTPRWRDLAGYYTRFGDVRELLARVDDRYVIMNAGDELQLIFPVPPGPVAGWTRDFVLIGDGWVKDGDFNTSFSATVEPLPSHDRPAYDTAPPVELEDDPVYRRHPDDWRIYHTRFVAPDGFLAGLHAGRH